MCPRSCSTSIYQVFLAQLGPRVLLEFLWTLSGEADDGGSLVEESQTSGRTDSLGSPAHPPEKFSDTVTETRTLWLNLDTKRSTSSVPYFRQMSQNISGPHYLLTSEWQNPPAKFLSTELPTRPQRQLVHLWSAMRTALISKMLIGSQDSCSNQDPCTVADPNKHPHPNRLASVVISVQFNERKGTWGDPEKTSIIVNDSDR